jgi:hypothetical protein
LNRDIDRPGRSWFELLQKYGRMTAQAVSLCAMMGLLLLAFLRLQCSALWNRQFALETVVSRPSDKTARSLNPRGDCWARFIC